jgi:ABC-type multidrug transport system fused ATPase/permease subunit
MSASPTGGGFDVVPKKEMKNGLKEAWAIVRRLSGYVENDWYLIVLSVLGQIGNSATTLSFPWLIGLAQDKAGRGHSFAQFKDFIISGSAVLAVASVSSLLRIYCCGHATDRISTRLKKALYGSYLEQDIQYFDEAKSGELLTILDKDVNEASELFTEQVIGFMRAFNSSVNGSIMLYLVSPKLCGITLACVPFVGIGGTLMFINNHKKKKAMRAVEAATMDYVVERVQSISTIRLNGKEDAEREKYAQFMESKLALSKSMHCAQGLFMSFTNICTNVCLGVLLGVGGGMVGRGEITAGDLSKFAMQSAFVGLGFSSLVKVYGSIRSAIASCAR